MYIYAYIYICIYICLYVHLYKANKTKTNDRASSRKKLHVYICIPIQCIQMTICNISCECFIHLEFGNNCWTSSFKLLQFECLVPYISALSRTGFAFQRRIRNTQTNERTSERASKQINKQTCDEIRRPPPSCGSNVASS